MATKVTKVQQIDFINRIAPIIKQVGNERGYKIVSPFIAMACKEGNFGESTLAKKYSNHFGMKAGTSWVKAGKPVVNLKTLEEYQVGKLTQIVDVFRVYEGATKEQADINGINGFFDFISTKRYENVKKQTTPLGIVTELKKAGYMTSSAYVNSIVNDYIPKYDLTKYDEIKADNKPIVTEKTYKETTIKYPTLLFGMRDANLDGKYIESWQNYLASLGILDLNSVAVKGYFDTNTHFAVRKYQDIKGIRVDGIIGIETWKTSPAYKE